MLGDALLTSWFQLERQAFPTLTWQRLLRADELVGSRDERGELTLLSDSDHSLQRVYEQDRDKSDEVINHCPRASLMTSENLHERDLQLM